MAAEDVAVRDASVRLGAVESNNSLRARTISIHFLQPNSKSVDLMAWSNDAEEQQQKDGLRARSSQVEARRGDRLCNTATIVWGDEL